MSGIIAVENGFELFVESLTAVLASIDNQKNYSENDYDHLSESENILEPSRKDQNASSAAVESGDGVSNQFRIGPASNNG